MAAPAVEIARFGKIGVPPSATELSRLRVELGILGLFIQFGLQANQEQPEQFLLLSRMAKQFGSVVAPKDSLFVTTVGPRTKISTRDQNGTRVPMRTNHYGIAVGRELTPIPAASKPVAAYSYQDFRAWNYGAVALKVDLVLSQGPTPTTNRIYLGPFSFFNNLRIMPKNGIEEHIESLHSLSVTGRPTKLNDTKNNQTRRH